VWGAVGESAARSRNQKGKERAVESGDELDEQARRVRRYVASLPPPPGLASSPLPGEGGPSFFKPGNRQPPPSPPAGRHRKPGPA
jgi:hypothetical protein